MDALLPAAFFAGGFAFSLLALHKTDLRVRLILLILVLLCGFMTISALPFTTLDFVLKSNITLVTLIGVSHITHLLVIVQYELPSLNGRSKNGDDHHGQYKRTDYLGAARMVLNPRYIGTALEIRQLPRRGKPGNLPYLLRYIVPSYLQHELSHFRYRLSPRLIFVLDRITDIVLIYYAELLIREYLPDFTQKDIHPVKEDLFRQIRGRDLTWRDVRLRAILAFYVPFTSWARFTAWHSGLAACFVGFGIDEPVDWPPLFGDIREAYSLRQYWGVFWHGLVYRSYVGIAKFIATNIVRLPREWKMLYGIWVAGCVFLFSGLVHVGMSKYSGFWCAHWNEFYWFWLNFCAVVAEDVLVWFAERIGLVRRMRRGARRVLGYAWVFFFLFWSIPKFQFERWGWRCRPVY